MDASSADTACHDSLTMDVSSADTVYHDFVTYKESQWPAFSQLSDIVWYFVLDFLPTNDRFNMSRTCQALHQRCDSKAAWKRVTLELTANNIPGKEHVRFGRLSEDQESALETFGHHFQEVVLNTPQCRLDPKTYASLLALIESSAFEIFTVKLEVRTYDLPSNISSNIEPVLPSCLNLFEAPSLKPNCVLHIDFKFEGSACELFFNLSKFPSDIMLKYISTMKLEFNDYYFSYLLGIKAPSVISDLVGRLPALQHLTVGDYDCSNQLLKALTYSCQKNDVLWTFAIYGFQHKTGVMGKCTETLSSTAWNDLVTVCSQLQVFVSIGSLAATAHVNAVIKPEAHLTGITVEGAQDKYFLETLTRLCWDHCTSLRKLKIVKIMTVKMFPDSFYRRKCPNRLKEIPLASVVRDCSKLEALHYSAAVDYEDVVKIAAVDYEDVVKIAKLGRQWRRLEIGGPVKIKGHSVWRVRGHRSGTRGHSVWRVRGHRSGTRGHSVWRVRGHSLCVTLPVRNGDAWRVRCHSFWDTAGHCSLWRTQGDDLLCPECV